MRDKRYGSRRWKATRLDVLHRDRHTCFVPACAAWADVADHIVAVYDGMPDWQFFSMDNLRGACRSHNVARGFAARLQRDLHDESAARPQPSQASRWATITADYSRKPK